MLNITIFTKGLLHCSYGQPLYCSEGFLVLIWCAILKLKNLKKKYFFYDIDRTCLGPDDETGE